jgi:hypothetical protein
LAVHAGGKHFGVVYNKHIILIENVEHIMKHAVFDFSFFGIDYQQSRLVTGFQGLLSYEFLWKLIFKLGQFHLDIVFPKLGREININSHNVKKIKKEALAFL